MKIILWANFTLFFIIFSLQSRAIQYAFQINFTDKNNSPYTLTAPNSYLSLRAIERRATQSISIDSTDLPVIKSYVDSVIKLTGGVLHEVSKWQNLCVVLDTDTVSIHLLDGVSFVKNYKLVGVYDPLLHHKKNGKFESDYRILSPFVRATGDQSYYSDTWSQTTVINGDYLHDKGLNGAGKLIAVLDAGFTGTNVHQGFDSLRFSGRLIDMHNFSYSGDYVFTDDYHGTAVLSTIAAYVPDTFVGAAPLAQYALYITEIDPTEQPMELINLLCGVERADSIGADVITCSLGYNTFDDPADNFVFARDFDGKTTIAAKAVNTGTQKGMLFVASAGNEKATSWHKVLTPGDADSALTIGSVMVNGAISYSSGTGYNAAHQVKPDVCAVGEPASVIDGSNYTSAGGTSFSTPQIAGWAACLWESKPDATPFLIRSVIQQCASQFATPDSIYGYGIANFKCSYNLLHKIDTSVLPSRDTDFVLIKGNPFDAQLSFDIAVSIDEKTSIKIIDIIDREYLMQDIEMTKGDVSRIQVNTQTWALGVYILIVQSTTIKRVYKLVKI